MADTFLYLTKDTFATDDNGQPVYVPIAVNVRAIAFIERNRAGSLVSLTGSDEDFIAVKEEYDDICFMLKALEMAQSGKTGGG